MPGGAVPRGSDAAGGASRRRAHRRRFNFCPRDDLRCDECIHTGMAQKLPIHLRRHPKSNARLYVCQHVSQKCHPLRLYGCATDFCGRRWRRSQPPLPANGGRRSAEVHSDISVLSGGTKRSISSASAGERLPPRGIVAITRTGGDRSRVENVDAALDDERVRHRKTQQQLEDSTVALRSAYGTLGNAALFMQTRLAMAQSSSEDNAKAVTSLKCTSGALFSTVEKLNGRIKKFEKRRDEQNDELQRLRRDNNRLEEDVQKMTEHAQKTTRGEQLRQEKVARDAKSL